MTAVKKDNFTIKRAACSFCINYCGIRVYLKDGKLTRVEGNPEDPISKGFICERGLTAIDFHEHPDRLNYPLKRVGTRGEGKWKRISWKQAMDEIAQKLKKIREKYGPEAVAILGGCPHGAGDWYSWKWCNLFGTPNCIQQGKNCGEAEILTDCAIYGYHAHQRNVMPGKTKCLIAWGWNPPHSDPRAWPRVLEAKQKGMKLIVIDPRLSETAQKADLWLQIRPGTDGALALGMLNVVINEDLYDREFVEKWCSGFEEIRRLVQEYPPDKVASICEVEKAKIVQAARLYATNKPAIISRNCVISQISTGSKSAAMGKTILRAITGSLDVEGGNILSGPLENFAWFENLHYDKLLKNPLRKKDNVSAHSFPIASVRAYEMFTEAMKKVYPNGFGCPMYMIAPSPVYIWRAILEENPYPMKAVFTQGNNTLCSLGNADNFYKAFKSDKLDLHVCMDQVMTPTAELADYVLPATDCLERPNISLGWGLTESYVCAEQAVEPLYERKDDYQLWRELGTRLGFGEYFPKTLEAMYDKFLQPTGMTFREFVSTGKYGHIATLKYAKYKEKGFGTPSGKVELVPSIFEKLGYDPLPRYEEPRRSPISTPDLAEKYPLILISGSRIRQYLHSAYRQMPTLRKMHPDPVVQINPETAQKLNIRDGDWVNIETPEGKIKQKAQLTSGIRPNVVHADGYWWFPEKTGHEPCLFGVRESDINMIVPDDPKDSDFAGDNYFRALLCKVYK